MLFFETTKVAEIVDAADIKGAGVTSSYYSLAQYGRVAAHLKTGTVPQGQTATVTLLQATDAAGTGAKTLKAVASAAAGVGGQAFSLSVEASASELDLANGYGYVAVKVESSEPAAAVTGAAFLIQTEPRYAPVS